MSFDEQPDGDIHGECAAEIEKLVRELRIQAEHFERAWQLRGDGIDRLRSQIDACRPYLKEGETPAECLARNRADIVRLMGKWGAEKMRSAKLRDDLDKIAQTTGSAGRPTKQRPVSVISAIGPQPVVLVKKSNTGHPTPTTKEIQHGKFE